MILLLVITLAPGGSGTHDLTLHRALIICNQTELFMKNLGSIQQIALVYK